ncbi:MAG: ATP-binding cassette domain-containing protein, partial [Haloferacaceae archaeon]
MTDRLDAGVTDPVGRRDASSAEATDPAVAVSDLVVTRGEATVLDGVSLTVDPGQVVGVVGPNGVGKTTLLRAINGTLAPARGAVRVHGERMADLSARAAARLVATVPQETGVDFAFTVRETVGMGRTAHVGRLEREGVTDREAVERAMARTGVDDLADRPVTAVSGGERSRVLLARALAQEAPVLVLDEPTASLDINHQVRTLELVDELAGEGRTLVTAIHDLDLAARYCDELILLADGGVLAAGPPPTVLTEGNLAGAFDARARVVTDPVTGSPRVTALPDVDGPSGDGRPPHVHVVGGGGSATRLLHALDAAGYRLSVGALNEGDRDARTARELEVEAVTVPPYAAVDDEAAARVRELATAADAAVLADVPVGEGNLPNLDAVSAADGLVAVAERPFSARNHAGEAGRAAWRRVRERARVVDPDGALDAV